jgi:hypothetical protein
VTLGAASLVALVGGLLLPVALNSWERQSSGSRVFLRTAVRDLLSASSGNGADADDSLRT